MVSKIKKEQDKLIIDDCLSKNMSPSTIQKKHGISRTSYYRYVKEIFSEITSEDAKAQYDTSINSSYEKLMEIVFEDLDKCKDDIDAKCKVISNAIKLTKDRLDYYLKTGKIREEAKEVNVNSKNIIMTEIDFMQKYLIKREGESDKEDNVNDD